MLISNDKNYKNFYRAIKYIYLINNYDLPHDRIKRIIFDEYKSESYLEKEVLKLRDSYLYIINNLNQSLSLEIIDRAYYLLTNIHLDENILFYILSYYYQNIDKEIFYQVTSLHLEIINKIEYKNIEFAFILSNYIMIKNKRNALILRNNKINKYYQLIKEKDIQKLSLLFLLIESRNNNDKENLPSLKEILTKLKQIKEELKIKYNISNLYIYGSFTQDLKTPNSDLDLIVIFNNDLFHYETKENIKEIKKYLKEKLDIEIDILSFTNTLKRFDTSSVENLLQII